MDDMTIRDVRVFSVRLPWVERPRLSLSASTEMRNLLIVEVETQGGIIGLGYLHVLSPVLDTLATCLVEAIIPQVVGRSATAIEAIWKSCWQRVYGAGRMGVVVMAMSAIDIALWDAIGKRAAMPLHRLWGHYRSEIPVYGSGCLRGLGRFFCVDKSPRLFWRMPWFFKSCRHPDDCPLFLVQVSNDVEICFDGEGTMNWNEFLQWSRMGFIACCALVVQLTLSLMAGVEARELRLQQKANGLPGHSHPVVQSTNR